MTGRDLVKALIEMDLDREVFIDLEYAGLRDAMSHNSNYIDIESVNEAPHPSHRGRKAIYLG